MKTNLSSKMHLFIIISSVIVAIGIAMGLIFQFATDGYYFNFSDDLASYKSVTATYANIDFSGKNESAEDIMINICDAAFKEGGVSDYSVEVGTNSNGGVIVYKFLKSTDETKLASAVEKINSEIKANTTLGTGSETSCVSNAAYSEVEALFAGNKMLTMTYIVAAVALVVHFLYFLIRYKLTMALAAVLADVHNVALFLSLLSITRAPVSSTVITFALITLLITVAGTCFLFDGIKKKIKADEGKTPAFELVDGAADECLILNIAFPATVAIIALVFFILMTVSAMSLLAVLAPVVCALISAVVCIYGTAFFIPSVYSRFKLLGDNFKANQKRPVKSKNK